MKVLTNRKNLKVFSPTALEGQRGEEGCGRRLRARGRDARGRARGASGGGRRARRFLNVSRPLGNSTYFQLRTPAFQPQVLLSQVNTVGEPFAAPASKQRPFRAPAAAKCSRRGCRGRAGGPLARALPASALTRRRRCACRGALRARAGCRPLTRTPPHTPDPRRSFRPTRHSLPAALPLAPGQGSGVPPSFQTRRAASPAMAAASRTTGGRGAGPPTGESRGPPRGATPPQAGALRPFSAAAHGGRSRPSASQLRAGEERGEASI